MTTAPPVRAGHLPFGAGEIGVTSRYLTRAGQPWLPVSGEFHFSRHPRGEWREELLKLRAGGVTIVASYLFWLHHEETEGQITFSGHLDVRHFVTLCGELGLDVVARVGPWVHAEARNGGLPDWVLADCAPRTDDPAYLTRVRGWYTALAEQLRGLDHASGGPVVAIQIENEYHGAPEHLATLKRLAVEVGLRAPLWTATAWGGVRLPGTELLPLYGGYADGFWFDTEVSWDDSCRANFLFSHDRDDPGIGADLRGVAGSGWSAPAAPAADFPFLTCELGGGMATAYHRRPRVDPDDVTALALTKLGSGANLLGYYVYHGGTNPVGRHHTFQESHATGYPNDLPVLSYDFQAPLGEYGQYRRHYHQLRLLHLMLADFGELLAPMPMALPATRPESVTDYETLRWSLRTDGTSGFLFVNNHQPYEPLPPHRDVRFRLELPGGVRTLPHTPITVPTGASFCWPVNVTVAGLRLAYATAQPVCLVDLGDAGQVLVLAAIDGMGDPELALAADTVADVTTPDGAEARLPEGGGADLLGRSGEILVRRLRPGIDCLVTARTTGGTDVRVLVLDAANARRLYRGEVWGRPRLVLAAADDEGVVFDDDAVRLHTTSAQPGFAVFPAPATPLAVAGARVEASRYGLFTRYAVTPDRPFAESRPLAVERLAGAGPARRIPLVASDSAGDRASAPVDADFDQAARYRIEIPDELLASATDVLVRVEWVGDVLRAYHGARLVADAFYQGRPWEFGLRRCGPGPLEIRLLPLRRDAPVRLPSGAWPAFGDAGAVEGLTRVTAVPRHTLTVTTRL